MTRPPLVGSRIAVAAGLLVVLLGSAACAEIETKKIEGYQPASLSEADKDGIKTVTLTDEAAKRVELRTAAVGASGRHLTIPYEALIYDDQGNTWVYTMIKPLTYKRARVQVASVTDKQVTLSVGPAAGTAVVANGSTQVYGAELEMAGKH